VALGATALYAFNDWWLKAHWPGLLSGKLSDVAGMVVLPLTLHALAELCARRPLGRRWLLAMVLITMAGFSAVELLPAAEAAWCWSWGALQWPFRAGWALAQSGALPPVRPVLAWADPTDLLTVPFGALALLVEQGAGAGAHPALRPAREQARQAQVGPEDRAGGEAAGGAVQRAQQLGDGVVHG
jgi:hypothetical protein